MVRKALDTRRAWKLRSAKQEAKVTNEGRMRYVTQSFSPLVAVKFNCFTLLQNCNFVSVKTE